MDPEKFAAELSPLTNLERRFKKNPRLYATAEAFDALEDAAMREVELLKAEISRLFDARIAEVERIVAAQREQKK
jgi:hypothetical protein